MRRRDFLAATGALGGASLLTACGVNPAQPSTGIEARLTAAPGRRRLLGVDGPQTGVWAYNGEVPGPLLRCRPGDTLDLRLHNRLPAATSVHWHGLRVPNAMDGVPGLTQAPVAPGEDFHYRFTARNSGTFWYHPHFASAEQLERGLHGVIVVEDLQPPSVDRELVWVLDDWRLLADGSLDENFGNRHDASHGGRLGNTATVNGRVPPDLTVRRGERIRLRLVNVANAWIFGLDFQGHNPRVIAYDGHAVAPHPPPGGLVTLGPSQRVDLILDLTGEPGQRYEITDRFYSRNVYKLLDLVYAEQPLRAETLPPVPALPPPALPQADLSRAETHQIVFAGGAMGGMRSARLHGVETDIRALVQAGRVWAINGVSAAGHHEPPMLKLRLGESYILELVNDTAFAHPIHLHGHPVRVLDVDGQAPPWPLWRDSLLLAARKRARVALVADNPGLWMLHCHIPEHQEAGMMAVVEVA